MNVGSSSANFPRPIPNKKQYEDNWDAIFGKKMKAVEVCTNRFDDDTKNSFIELYTKVDAGATAEQISEEARQADITSQMDDNDSESDDDSAI